METILLNKGYKKTNNKNEYEKNGWVIRLDENKIEVFNDPDKVLGKYYYDSVSKVDIEVLLNEIEEFNY